MNIKGIAFDLEGTVVNVEPAHHEGHLRVAEELGLRLTVEEAMIQIPHFIGGPDEKVAEDIWMLSGRPVSVPVEEVLRRDKAAYNELVREMDISPRPGWYEVFCYFGECGLEVSIGSLTPTDQARMLLIQSRVGILFPANRIVLKEHVANPKPAPDVFLKTAEVMGIPPQRQLVFEDSPRGVQSALAAGSKAVVGMPVYGSPAALIPLIEAGAKRIFMDWREIAPRALIENLSS